MEEYFEQSSVSHEYGMGWDGVDDDNSSPTSEQHMLTEKAFFNGTRF